MKKAMMLGLVVFISSLMALNSEGSINYLPTVSTGQNENGQDNVNGVQYRPTYAPINNNDLPNPDDPTSNIVYGNIIQPRNPKKDESGSGWINWGTDLLVYSGAVGSGQDFDENPSTSTIYAAFDTDHSTMDSVVVVRSTDAGSTWSVLFIGTNTDGAIVNPKVRVFTNGGQTWVAFIGIWIEPSGTDILWMRRITVGGGSSTWEQVDDSVSTADLDAETGTSAYLYCTYVREQATYDAIYAARNDASGSGWQQITDLFDDPQILAYPAIAAGTGGNVGVTFIDDRITTDEQVRIKRSTDYGATWLGSQQVSNTVYPLSYTDIASTYGGPNGWIFVTYDVSGSGEGDNLGFYYSTNSGSAWTYGGLVGYTTDDENMGTVRTRKSSTAITLAYNQDVGGGGDSTMFSWTTSSAPTNWPTPVRINDYSATGYWPPCAGWITSGGGYSAVLYTSWTMTYNCYLDWFGNTDVAEVPGKNISSGIFSIAPNPSLGSVNITYGTKTTGFVNISLYDASGRLVQAIARGIQPVGIHNVRFDNSNLAAGIYFVQLETSDGVENQAMTVVR